MKLDEMLALLWPDPCTVRRETLPRLPSRLSRRLSERLSERRAPASGERAFLVLPSLTEPRLLLPTGRREAAAALGRARRQVSRRDRLVNGVAGFGLRHGAGVLGDRVVVSTPGAGMPAPGAGSIESYLGDVFGRPVHVAIFLGPRRGNRKPVLQVIDRDGSLLGVAKLGIDSRTRDLVRAEAAALGVLADAQLTRLVVPALVHHGRWRDIEVVVQSALEVPQAAPRAGDRFEAAREVAGLRGCGSALGESDYLRSLEKRLLELPADPTSAVFAELAALVRERDDGRPMRFGCWHGDWSVWNMAAGPDGRLLVWDWERFAADVPLGFDLLHFAFSARVNKPASVADASADLLADAAGILRPLGVPAGRATTTAGLYLLELAIRYRADRQDRSELVGGQVARWLEPAVGHLRGTRPSPIRTGSGHG